jgi:3-carboxy-cis,cis-muconate cycloisomerase
MPLSPTDSNLFSPLFGDPGIAAIFSDEQTIRYWLEVEAALARAEGYLGIIPATAAAQIVNVATSLSVDIERLQAGIQRDGFPIIELVRQIREKVGEPFADYVHRGATTQDILDTALVLQIRAALERLEESLHQLIKGLAVLVGRYRHTLMAGRTHSQQAQPITFGFKVAGWLGPLLRHRQRLSSLKPRLMVVQLGGAVGTLAALGESGIAVQAAFAHELGLAVPVLPWHTQRDNLVEFAGWLSLVSGSLAKMAQDILLLTQTEVGEVSETNDPARGGSSTMPHKSNPIVSELILAAARTNASLVSSLHHALVQEQERGTHGWQVEWLTLPQMMALTGAALRHALFLSDNLVVNEVRMLANVKRANGLMQAEQISLALSHYMSLRAAKELVAVACQTAIAQNRHLVEVMQEMAAAPMDWQALSDDAAYLGSLQVFIDRILQSAVSG